MGLITRISNLFNRNKVVVTLPEQAAEQDLEPIVVAGAEEHQTPEEIVENSVEVSKRNSTDMSDVMLKVFSGEYNNRLEKSTKIDINAQKEQKLKSKMEDHLLGVINRMHEKSKNKVKKSRLEEKASKQKEEPKPQPQFKDSHDKPKMKITNQLLRSPKPKQVADELPPFEPSEDDIEELTVQETKAPQSKTKKDALMVMDTLMSQDPSQIFSDGEPEEELRPDAFEQSIESEQGDDVIPTNNDPIVAKLKEVFYED